ncbi:hypothetical protein BKH46_03835 [Helicobacter sp. 12S02634-8]|uniref:arginase family protein n=1 Tax=Helicobacter sp. 12S02634-8 TaxID=1476199 RepID=UPI000BA52A4B|nr:arginase family protein [Helicobacter sp. 12S02634-8]PAF47565.1 hypothetical protein BKH46_03835 [Helicobacter sp. 12S02634-8]
MCWQVVEIYSDMGASKKGAIQGVALLDRLLQKEYPALLDQAIKIINNPSTAIYKSSTNQDKKQALLWEYCKNIQDIYAFFSTQLIPTIEHIASNQGLPLIISGDHTNALGTIQALKKVYAPKSMGIIWIDAHADLHTPYDTSSGNLHGMPLGGLLHLPAQGTNSLDPKAQAQWEALCSLGGENTEGNPLKLVYMGVRSMEKSEQDAIKHYQIPLFTIDAMRQDMVGVIDQVMIALQGVECVYLSVDVDVLDGKLFTSTGVRENHGLYVSELDLCLELLIKRLHQRLVAVEFTEFNPELKDSSPKDNAIIANTISKAITLLTSKP